MKNLFSTYSIKNKLALIIMATTGTALIIAGSAFVIYDTFTLRKMLNTRIVTQANIIGKNSTTPINEDNSVAANETLAALQGDSSIAAARIYKLDGTVLATYTGRHIDPEFIPRIFDETADKKRFIIVRKPVFHHENIIGTVFIVSDMRTLNNRLYYYILISLLVLLSAFVAATVLSTRLQKLIYIPIQHLADIAKRVAEAKDYRIRANKFAEDEIGGLIDDFNIMLSQIEERDHNLEALVDERTEALRLRNDKLKFEILERKKAQKMLLDSEERFKSAFDGAAIGMALMREDQSIFQVNQAFCEMLGYSSKELKDKYLQSLTFSEDIHIGAKRHNELIKGIITHYQLEKRFCHIEGNIIWGLVNVSAVRDMHGELRYAIVQIQDITEAHQLSSELSYQASHDALTGLTNRREFENRIELILNKAKSDNSEHALCFLDLDQFKLINDTCGHIAGDELLKQLGNLLKQQVRKRDTLARLGGDEFGILMEYCNLVEGQRVAGMVRELVEDFQFIWEGERFKVGVSIGLVPITSSSGGLTEILKAADTACYAAKDLGRNRVHVFDDQDEEMTRRYGEIQWLSTMHRALEEDWFRLYLQAIKPINNQRKNLQHFEVLLRMHDESGHLVPPGAFLPAAERYNLSPKLDQWVITNTFKWFADHPQLQKQLGICSINLSGLTLNDDHFQEFVTRQFEKTALDPGKICFEITETAVIANLTTASRFIAALKKLGCLFALDDFGSGLSSFAYLKNLPVDFLKIDGMFVRDIVKDPIDLAMVKSINEIGKVMNKQTIAEFVEDEEILALLKKIGVDYAQGYGIGHPFPIEELLSTRRYCDSREDAVLTNGIQI